jgi:DNA-binding NarL/FixJ family response regulator
MGMPGKSQEVRGPQEAERPDCEAHPHPRLRKRVFLVDDHAVFREGFRELLNSSDDLLLCGEASTAEDALQEIPGASPDIVLVDLILIGTGGMELVKSLTALHPRLPVLILTMHDEFLFAERALKAGAKGYIMKRQAIRELKSAIHRILEGGMYVSEELTDRLLKSVVQLGTGPSMSPLELLSDREIEVFELIGKGLGTSLIARTLHLGVKTVETYRAKIKQKLDLKDGAALLQSAMKWVHGADAAP